jgi:hypothetical protein
LTLDDIDLSAPGEYEGAAELNLLLRRILNAA